MDTYDYDVLADLTNNDVYMLGLAHLLMAVRHMERDLADQEQMRRIAEELERRVNDPET